MTWHQGAPTRLQRRPLRESLSVAVMVCVAGIAGVISTSGCMPVTVTSLPSVETPKKVSTGPTNSVVYSETLLHNMISVTGVRLSSAQHSGILTTYFGTRNGNGDITDAGSASRISETGAAKSITAPMWMAITSLSAEVCRVLVTQEAATPSANRRFFARIDFARGTDALTTGDGNDIVRRMSRSFWGRNETPLERLAILSEFNKAFAASNDSAETNRAMVFLCTAMLSSLDSHRL